ncbi:MAG: tripartite tricarboxylate transporter TctB family protein [Rhodospirillaceae bacterium]
MTSAKRDIWIGGVAMAIAALGEFVVIPLGVTVPSSIKVLALSPDFWPRIIMFLLAGAGAMILFQGLAAGKLPIAPPPVKLEGDNEVVHFPMKAQVIRVTAAFAGLFVFYALSPFIGMVVGCMVLVTLATRILGVQSWAKSLALAVILPVVLYFFFANVAQVPIPLGLFEDLR